MSEENQHKNKLAISILTENYHDYPKNWWHYNEQYKMLIKMSESLQQENERLKIENHDREQYTETIKSLGQELDKKTEEVEEISKAAEKYMDFKSVGNAARLNQLISKHKQD